MVPSKTNLIGFFKKKEKKSITKPGVGKQQLFFAPSGKSKGDEKHPKVFGNQIKTEIKDSNDLIQPKKKSMFSNVKKFLGLSKKKTNAINFQ